MRERILIVDDDRNIGELLKDFLESLGYEVSFFESAREALPKIEAGYFDMVITDYSMPDMNGIDLTRFIKQTRPFLPIIGISESCNERKFIDAGADHFVSKPFGLRFLREIVKNYFKTFP